MIITLTNGTVLDPIEMPQQGTYQHTWGEKIDFGDNSKLDCDKRVYYQICSDCNEMRLVSGKYADHNFETNYTGNAYCHWFTCKTCGYKGNYGEHILDQNNTCSICEQPLAGTAGVLYDISADGTCAEVIGYIGTASEVCIASTYNGLPVTAIYQSVFRDNDSITSIIIPDSVITIGDYAFYSCGGLTSVTIPDSVTTIGSYAFRSCSNLTSVTIGDSVTTIGFEAFAYCYNLTSVTLGNSVANVAHYAFNGCNSALYTEYQFGKYVGTTTNPYAILIEISNKNFSTYEIHPDTQVIAYGVFENCERLTNITIPNGVKGISDWAFRFCKSLTSVTIPDSVTTIGSEAFYACNNLTDVYYTGSEAAWAQIAIGSYNSNLTNATIHYNCTLE